MNDAILLYEVFLNEENKGNSYVWEFYKENILEFFNYLCITYHPSNSISFIRNGKDSIFTDFWFNYGIIKGSSNKEDIESSEYWIWRKLRLIAYFELEDMGCGSGDSMYWASKSWIRKNILFDKNSEKSMEVIYI